MRYFDNAYVMPHCYADASAREFAFDARSLSFHGTAFRHAPMYTCFCCLSRYDAEFSGLKGCRRMAKVTLSPPLLLLLMYATSVITCCCHALRCTYYAAAITPRRLFAA